METWRASCCFCNHGVIENKTDPIDVKVTFNEDIKQKTKTFQLFFAHFDCFKEKLHPSIEGYFVKEEEE